MRVKRFILLIILAFLIDFLLINIMIRITEYSLR